MHKYLIGLSTDEAINLNIPPEYWSINKYRATLGHKVNHSFNRTNVDFGNAIHPRYGPIRTIIASEDIKKGDEILIDYQYEPVSAIPRWYEEAYREEIGKPWPGEHFYDESSPMLHHDYIVN